MPQKAGQPQEIYLNMDFVSTEILKNSVLVFSKFYKTITLMNSSISNCQYVLLKRLGQQHFNLFPGTQLISAYPWQVQRAVRRSSSCGYFFMPLPDHGDHMEAGNWHNKDRSTFF